MSSAAQAFWDSLPPEEQARRLAYYERTTRRAYDHCCSILIGCPHEPATETRSGTGILIKVEEQYYLLTAAHVVDCFAERLDHRPAHFQVGQLEINPWSNLAYEDKVNDLAAIAIGSKDVIHLGCVPYEPIGPWPPLPPKDGDFVHLCGFASANRLNRANATIESYSLHLFGRVMMAHDGNFYARIDRGGIPTENAAMMPPPGQPLGGMSGGPVMLHFDEPLPLVGIISEMSCLMDAIRVGALSSIEIPRRIAVSLPALANSDTNPSA
jgi:hypothetical protein